jgi:YhcH/YjgK/YiaL family protein
MILDHINNCECYLPLHPHFKLGFDFIRSFNINNFKEGKNEILGNEVFALVFDLKNFEPNSKLEAHNNYIDIQFVLSGVEKMGWKNRLDCNIPEDNFNTEKDVQFFQDQPSHFFIVQQNHFALFYPNDAHAPLLDNNALFKIVIKVKV